jgi:hypothetical protein
MAAEQHHTGTEPVACSLAQADLAAQAERWEQLAALAMTERAETAHGLRLRFRQDPGVAQELRELVAVETDCCRWANWAVREAGEQLELDIRATGDGIAALHGMFSSLHPAAARAARPAAEPDPAGPGREC